MGHHALLALFLLARELDRVAQRADQRLEVDLRLAALHPQEVDLALHVFLPRLRLLHDEVGPSFGLADDPRRLERRLLADILGRSARALTHVVGRLLRRHQRAAQASFQVAILAQRAFEPGNLLAEALVLTQRLLVALGCLEQERTDLGPIEAAHRRGELRLPQVERRDVHTAIGQGKASKLRGLGVVVTAEHLGSRKSPCRPGPASRLPEWPPRSPRSCPSTAHGASGRGRRRPAIRREDRAAVETTGARLRASRVRAAASSARQPGRRGMRPRPQRVAAPRRDGRRTSSPPPRDPPGSAVPEPALPRRPPGRAFRAARRYRPTGSWRTPAPPFGPYSSAGGLSDAT